VLVLGHTYILFTALCVLLFSTLWMVVMLFGLCICFGLYGFVMTIYVDVMDFVLLDHYGLYGFYMDFLMLMDIFVFTNELMLLF